MKKFVYVASLTILFCLALLCMMAVVAMLYAFIKSFF